jgi:acetyl esterase
MTKTRMAQPLRGMLGLVGGALKLKVMPGLDAMIAKPHEERWATTIPGAFFRKPDPSVLAEDVLVEGRGGQIPVRVYRRPDTPAGAPGYLFIHGGGFIDGGVPHCDHVCREIAARSDFVVVGVSYRLAPQHPFPAGLEDCQDVLTWMAEERPGDLDAERLAVAGESAGGNFTTALALWARDTDGPRIAHHAPVYPLTDFTFSYVDWQEGNPGNPGVTPEVAAMVRDLYLPDGDYENPMASVVLADHRDLPPALVVTCEYDILREEGIALAKSYAGAGVDTTHVHMDDMPHGYLLMTRVTKRATETIDLLVSEAKRYLQVSA